MTVTSTERGRPASAPYLRPLVWIGGGILALLLFWSLRASAVVAIPVVAALMIAVVVSPLDRAIADRLPHGLTWLGRVAVMLLLLCVLAGFFGGLTYSARQVTAEMPRISSALDQFMPPEAPGRSSAETTGERQPAGLSDDAPANAIPDPREALPADGGAVVDEAPGGGTDPAGGPEGDGEEEAGEVESSPMNDTMIDEAVAAEQALIDGDMRSLLNEAGSIAATWIADSAATLARGIVGAVGTFVGATVIVVFMVLLALSEGETWHRKLSALWPGGGKDWQHAVGVVSRKIRIFILVRAIMGIISAALYVGWLALFGIDLLFVWATITFLLGFIPNLGSLLSGVLPVLYAVVTKDLKTALFVAAGLLAIEQIIGNFLDPRMQGRHIAISPLVVLIAILLWGWIWGVAGALLAVPITVAGLVTFAHVPALRPIALLLSNQPSSEALMKTMED